MIIKQFDYREQEKAHKWIYLKKQKKYNVFSYDDSGSTIVLIATKNKKITSNDIERNLEGGVDYYDLKLFNKI